MSEEKRYAIVAGASVLAFLVAAFAPYWVGWL